MPNPDWPDLPLTEVFEVRSGLSKPASAFGSGYPFVTFKDVMDNIFLPRELGSLVRSSDRERATSSIQRGDVFLTRTSETQEDLGLSSVARHDYPEATFNGFTKRLRPKDSQAIDPEYAAYFFRSPRFRQAVSAFSSLSTRASLNNDMLARLTITLPDIDTQRSIGRTLVCLDDKIEQNRRTARALERLARAIFRAWFVDFEPVVAKAAGAASFPSMPQAAFDALPNRLVDSAIGPVPEGWEVKPLGDICQINARSVRKGEIDGEIEYVDIASVSVGQLDEVQRVPFAEAPSRARRRIQHGDTIWSCVRPNRRSYLFIHSPPSERIVSTGFAVLSPTEVGPAFLYQTVTQSEFVDYLVSNADGSAYPAVRADHFASAEILVPPGPLVDAFDELAMPMRDWIAQADSESRTLAELRDLLLPKLLSGQVKVNAN